ncbi:MAG: glycosyltransferase [Catalinimonas sp.]
MNFTLVSTVFNEAARLPQTLADLEAQSCAPAEIVVTDAGSTDGTYEALLAWRERSEVPVVVLQQPGCNVAAGRNLAIERATHDLIASTDFGCRFHPEWLCELTAPFASPEVEVVGGTFTVRREDVDTPAARADYLLSRGYQVQIDDHFSVSSRSIAYRKHVWEAIGGYPEWLTLAADDTIFWRQIRERGFKYVFAEQPRVYWMRHRDYRGFGKEAFRYGRGDGESGINRRMFWSHVGETGLRYALLAGLLTAPLWARRSGSKGVLLLAPTVLGLRSYRRALRYRSELRARGEEVTTVDLLRAFQMTEVVRTQYIKGYLRGRLKRTPSQQEGAADLEVR